MRGRGLKPIRDGIAVVPATSPAVRGRGLKRLVERLRGLGSEVARCARAWIETSNCAGVIERSMRRPLCAGVD